MANSDVIVSSEQGTILDYFGVANTYDPFTNQSKLQEVKDLNFNIPELPPFDLAEFVAVSTGLLATSLSFLNYCEFSILDKKTGKKITDLKNNIGEIGNSSFYPAENQIFWFNRDGLRGTFYLNKAHAGRVLHITSGMFSTTSITSGVLNDMFARTTGVPKYIQDINKSINDLKNQVKTTLYSVHAPNHQFVSVPNKFIGGLYINSYLQKNSKERFHRVKSKMSCSASISYGHVGATFLLGSINIEVPLERGYWYAVKDGYIPVRPGGSFKVDTYHSFALQNGESCYYRETIVLSGYIVNT